MYKLLNLIFKSVSALLICLFLSGLQPVLAEGWVLKNDDYTLPRSLLDQTLKARGFNMDAPLSAEHRQALMQELFIRENLLQQQSKVPATTLTVFEEKLKDYRRNQLARLILDVLIDTEMPDFLSRAKELYVVREEKQYRLPLRLRVRILRRSLSTPLKSVASSEQSIPAQLEAILSEIQMGSLAFERAVLQYSDDPKRTLNKGDSFWFQQGQKPDFIFKAAAALSAEQPLSDVLIHGDHAYLLHFIGRQEPVQQSFNEVKGSIVQELQSEYREEQRKVLLTALRDRFRNETEIHPDFQ